MIKPIRRVEFEEQLRGLHASQIEDAIKEVNRILFCSKKLPITISASTIGYGIVGTTVIKQFQAAGWTVRLIGDFRDGDYYEFS